MSQSNLNSFTAFVNEELPKRIYSNIDSTNVTKGMLLATTGLGLGVEFKSVSELTQSVNYQIKEANNIEVVNYQAEIPLEVSFENIINPIQVILDNVCFVETNDYEVIDGKIMLPVEDYQEFTETVTGINIKYLG